MAIKIEDLHRGVYEKIRLQLVAGNHCPDETTVATLADYKAAQAALKTAGNVLIEVFPVTSPTDRNVIESNSIVIDYDGETDGKIGDGRFDLQNAGTAENPIWQRVQHDAKTVDANYSIRIITRMQAAEPLMARAVATALSHRSFIQPYTEAGEPAGDPVQIFKLGGEQNVSKPGYYEKVRRFSVKDVYLTGPRILETLPTMTDLQFKPIV